MNNQDKIEQLEEEIQELKDEELGEVGQKLIGIQYGLSQLMESLHELDHDHSHFFEDSNAMDMAIASLDDAMTNVKQCLDELTH